ncbi:hypothetical protein SNE25_11975 [Mucilaginibacter sabulilitoris]|uniref:RNA polymerase alpha subunit C-terminal domain-containing protein n=1 Tax=Mucilaginibacter sabulilitoris TaxID=1173583 RepID=A0ABZ0TT07_9SPHI|nr:hypothetical protein [Mucilaginibacter sabulilitoris]WPU96236.1 hypothetical protein SNE25_11975 [Mucilaginibacter sabulilitoris]
MTPDSEILDQSIDKLDIIEEFKKSCAAMGYKTLKEITDTAPKELLCLEHFSYVWLAELIRFLKENGQLHRLQAIQGNSRI